MLFSALPPHPLPTWHYHCRRYLLRCTAVCSTTFCGLFTWCTSDFHGAKRQRSLQKRRQKRTCGSFPIGLISNWVRFSLGSILIASLPNDLPNQKWQTTWMTKLAPNSKRAVCTGSCLTVFRHPSRPGCGSRPASRGRADPWGEWTLCAKAMTTAIVSPNPQVRTHKQPSTVLNLFMSIWHY